MTSVQNHLRLSNGSSLLILCIILLFTSCGTTKRTKTPQRTRVPQKKERPQPKKEEVPTKKVEVPIVKNEQDKVIIDDTPDAIIKEGAYDVTLLLPLDTKQSVSSGKNDRFLMYYAGVQMAARKLSDVGASMRVNVVDTKDKKIDQALNTSVDSDTDLIIGPYDQDALKYAIGFAKRHHIPIVSPWQSLRKLKEENSHYIQLSPYLTEYYYRLMDHVSSNFDLEDVFIIGRKSNRKDQSRIAGFQKLAKAYFKDRSPKPMKEVYAELDDLNGEDPVFLQHMKEEKTTAIIIPNWSGVDYEYVYNLLRRISLEKAQNNVVVYGMFSMMDNPNIDFELFNILNLRVVTPKYLDQENYGMMRFKRDFLHKFGQLPTEDAYEGYDQFMFIGSALLKYGKNFQYHLEKEQDYYLQSGFKVAKVFLDDEGDAYDNIKYFENKNIDIIQFKEGAFRRIE